MSEIIKKQFSYSLYENLEFFQGFFENCDEYFVKNIRVGKKDCAVLMFDGMVNKLLLNESIIVPLISCDQNKPDIEYISDNVIGSIDKKIICDSYELETFILSGFCIILIDGDNRAIAAGIQGFPYRSVGEPLETTALRGSREGFAEPINANIALVRRRLKTKNFKTELGTVGKTSKTKYAVLYLDDIVSKELLDRVKQKLSEIDFDVVVNTGSLQPFLENNPYSIFSDVGFTERPDTLASKISEGRIGVILDGTPFALIVPFLFAENFHTTDDYSQKYFYASFMRILRYFAFFLSTVLPGLFVALSSLHYGMLPFGLLISLFNSEQKTPFPIMYEALLVYVLYEIVREAGMNLPKSMSHAVSIVGAVVIGEASVSAGIIGGLTVVVLSFTVIGSFLNPLLFDSTTILRFLFIIIGGTVGLYGVAALSVIVIVNLCCINSFGVPYMSPISPFSLKSMRDTIIRIPWTKLAKRTSKIQNLPGSDLDGNDK